MLKKVTLLLFTMLFISTTMAESRLNIVRKKSDKKVIYKELSSKRNRNLDEVTILEEDFSKFTAGSEDAPDGTRLDDPATYEISDEYFNSTGWSGLEVYQAGGCAFVTYSEEYQQFGMVTTPLLNTEGTVLIKCRMRTTTGNIDYAGYNIVSEDWETIDANMMEISGEWTEVSWYTSAGIENSYIHLYAFESDVLIDDIEIASCSLKTPIPLDETNVTANSFTANWESVEDADFYTLNLFAEHTATNDEKYFYFDNDFSDIESEGTMENPEIIESMELDYNGFYVRFPALIKGSIGVTGQYSDSYEEFGSITTSVCDLSSDNGKFNISFKALAGASDAIIVRLFSNIYGYYDVADEELMELENEAWTDFSLDMSGASCDSYIEISYLGSDYLFIDDFKLSQDIKAGEVKINNINSVATTNNTADIVIADTYLSDILFYNVFASKYILANDGIGDYIQCIIKSEETESRTIELNEGTSESETISIGEGDLKSYYAPLSNYGSSSSFSISQQIYTKEEINKENGLITSVSFCNKDGNSNTRNIVVYMSNTEKESYSDNYDWVRLDDSEIVYKGNFTFGAPDEWLTIELQKGFAYKGNNIVITVYDKSDLSIGYSGYDSFYAYPTDSLRGLYRTSTNKIDCNYIYEKYGYELTTGPYGSPANQYYVNNIKFEIEPIVIPDAPINIKASTINDSSISLSWTSVKNATNYNVYLNSEKIANVTETSYVAENLSAETEYCFFITSLNGDVESTASEEVCATTDKIQIPDSPKNINATAKSTSSIELTWGTAANAMSYNIYRDDKKIANVAETTFTDVNLEYNTQYCYTITSVNKGLESDKSFEVCAKTLGESIAEIENNFNIFPNPVNDILNIETSEIIEEISVYDVYGSQQSTVNGQQSMSIDVAELNSGVYFVKIRTSEGEIVKRFVKK